MKFLPRFARLLWMISAALIILLAVLVSLARALLPYLDDYRATLEARVSAYLGHPVAIEQLDTRLLGLTPSIILRKVTLKSAAADEPIAHFDEIRIGMDLYGSLRTRALVLRELVIVGGQLTVVRHAEGNYTIEGMVAMPRSSETTPSSSALGGWLLSQGRLAVRDTILIWRDDLHQRSLRFDKVSIELRNSGNRHRLNGQVGLPEGAGRELRIAVDIHGNPLVGKAWSGTVYAKADALRPAYWLPLVDANVSPLVLKSGEISTEMWSDWEQGVVVRSEGDLLIRDAMLATTASESLAVKEFSADMLWQRREAGWDFDLQKMQLQIGDGVPRSSRIHVAHRPESDLLLADQLQLEDVAALAMHLPLGMEGIVQRVYNLAPRGEVRRLRLERTKGGQFTSQGEFYELGIDAWESIPGFDGATGRWRSDSDGGEIYLDSDDVHFDAPQLFRAPLQIDRVAAVLSLRAREQGWHLAGRNIAASNADIVSGGELDVQFEPGKRPYLDLRLAFWNGNTKQVPRYVPARLMGEPVVTWLDGAFEGGTVQRGTLLFHGRIADFPFAARQGLFETRFLAEGVDLAFHPAWPRLKDFSGEVLFEDQSMAITPFSGTLFDTAIQQATVAIADLTAPLLEVSIDASPPAADVLRLLRETPLAAHVGSVLGEMSAAGASDLRLKLRIPLSQKMAERNPLHYEGAITLHDAQLEVWKGVTFQQMEGAVYFSDSDFRATALQGQLFDAPVTLTIKTDDAARTLVTGRGSLPAAAVQKKMRMPLLEHLQGESDWRALLYLPRAEGSHPSLEFHSSLRGMGIALPAPVGKPREETVPLSVRVAFSGDAARRVSITYGERLSGRLAFTGKESLPQRAVLHFGSGGSELPKSGWRISGVLEQLDWSRWRNLLPAGDTPAARVPLAIDMERLSLLQMAESAGTTAPLLPERLPPLELHVGDFSYHDWHLGKITATSRSDGQHWTIPDLHITAPHHDIRLTAGWRAGQGSTLDYSITSDNVEEMLRAFGFAAVIGKGTGTLTGKLEWDGVLSEFSWGKAQGNLTVEVKEGALVEVEPGAGRLFGLLSLQALPRRLMLDFRDLFQKGMQFDEIKGDIRISNGDAQTSNLYIKSPSAGILIEGRTGLVRRDYDHVITVVPNVSESVSIASAIAWGPQVAAAVLLFQNLFKKDIAKVTMIRYMVKGSWDDPQITRLQ